MPWPPNAASAAADSRSSAKPRAPASGRIEVAAVHGRRDRVRFVDLPYRLHRDEANWVPPLRRDVSRLLDRNKNPFFDHGEMGLWLAWRNGEPVGRISAQINRLHLDLHRDETGNFGFLEAIDDDALFAALLRTAEAWLRERGMRRIIGPYSPSMNDDIGLLISGFDTPPMVGMPYTPSYYPQHLTAAGYAKAKDLHALHIAYADLADQRLEQIERVTAQLRAQGRLGLRFLDPARFSEEIRLALDIYNEAWAENWGFLPATEAEVRQLAKQLAPVLPPQCVVFALADGEPAAMLVALPNINELLADLGGRLFPLGWLKLLYRLRFHKPKAARVILLGVRRRYRGSALSSALIGLMVAEIFRVGRGAGIETVELSWVLEDNKPSLEGCRALGGRLAKTYRIFGKML